jgi:hypothetical protein
MASHCSSDFCTGPGGVDDDIAATPGNRRPAATRGRAGWGAARPTHDRAAKEREAGRGSAAAAAGVRARRKEESGCGAGTSATAGREHVRDAILSFSKRGTPISLGSVRRECDVSSSLPGGDKNTGSGWTDGIVRDVTRRWNLIIKDSTMHLTESNSTVNDGNFKAKIILKSKNFTCKVQTPFFFYCHNWLFMLYFIVEFIKKIIIYFII